MQNFLPLLRPLNGKEQEDKCLYWLQMCLPTSSCPCCHLEGKTILGVGEVWGFELRASPLLARHFITWAMPPAIFALVIFEIESHVLLRPAWAEILLFYPSCQSWIIGRCRHAQLFLLRWRSRELLPWLALNYDLPNLSLPIR
jgi:hypothetical protein